MLLRIDWSTFATTAPWDTPVLRALRSIGIVLDPLEHG